MTEKQYYVYILTNERNNLFYVGMTIDLLRRMHEHKEEFVEGFTKKYKVKKLVYFEILDDFNEALHREKLIKKWKRRYKMDAIERQNPTWRDLFFNLYDCE